MRNEEAEQIELCEYIKEKYPNVVFNSDLSGIRVPQGLANKIKRLRSENGIPDISIDEPRGGWYGLKIEMKATSVTVFKKDGFLKKDEHIQRQWEMLIKLELKGYCCGFCCGFEQAKQFVDWYLSLPVTKNF